MGQFLFMELPKEFISRIRQDLPLQAEQLFAAIEAGHAITSLRLNLHKPSEMGWSKEAVPWAEQAYWLDERPVFTLDPAFHAGAYYVQESASMLVDAVLGQLPAVHRGLDVAAAPGGKSTLLANHLATDGWMVANEIVPKRAEILKSNLDKWGNSRVVVSNAKLGQLRKTGSLFDCILVDAPCSGEGMFRKDVDSRQHWKTDLPGVCSRMQGEMLEEILPMLEDGGHLIYSTCTFARVENEYRWQWLAAQGLEPVKLDFPDSWGFLDVHDTFPDIPARMAYRSVPGISRGEGFFICCFRKAGTTPKTDTVKKQQERHALGNLTLNLSKGSVLKEGKKGQLIIGREEQLQWCDVVGKELRILRGGTEAGQWQGKYFVPAHALALAADLQLEAETIPLSKQMALWYLSRSNFQPGQIPNGHFLLTYNQLPLGWGFNKQGQFVNCLPASEKIRMQV